MSAPDPVEWNPHYIAYCKAKGGRTPDETLARDEELYPGGKMCGFICWMNERIAEFTKSTGRAPGFDLDGFAKHVVVAAESTAHLYLTQAAFEFAA
ncbi:MAG: hypothetical protein ABIT01_05870 [Thermoanaerobaculia bacterium]